MMAPAFTLLEDDDTLHRDGVIALWNEAFHQPDGHNTPQVSIREKLAVHDGLFFVATIAGHVVGTTMAGYDGHRGWLYSVAVLSSQRGHGIGTALVRHAERALTQRGCLKINLQVVSGNEAVTAFYEALGYGREERISMGRLMGLS